MLMNNFLDRLTPAQRGYIILAAGVILLMISLGYFELLIHQILFIFGAVLLVYGFISSGLMKYVSHLVSRIGRQR